MLALQMGEEARSGGGTDEGEGGSAHVPMLAEVAPGEPGAPDLLPGASARARGSQEPPWAAQG